MVSCCWDSVDQATAAALLGVLFLYWVVGADFRMGKSDKSILGERCLVGYVSVRNILGSIEVSR